ncbi:MAG: DUF5103 domain-containing protein [Schleiferiaceae bacterium]
MPIKRFISLFLLALSAVLHGQVLRDTVVYDYLKSVQISPEGEPLDFPAYELGTKKGLQLSFDDLAYEWNNYSYRIFHCTKNWEKSDLLINQYLIGFKGNYLNNFAISVGTFVPYTHYSVKFPNAETKPRVSGNFVIEIFQNDDPDDLIIRRRFIVYENLVVPSVSVSRAVDLENFSTQQQVSASVNLIDYPIQDYFMDLDLSILQNRRWNNSKNNLKPTFINDGILTYNFMGSESFDGGTEFHTFDTKRLNQVGLGVKTSRLDTCWEVYLYEKKNRSISVYSFQNDINGRRFYNRADVGNPDLAGDYCWVEFYFESPELDLPVYVYGQLSDWELLPEFRLDYHKDRGAYSKKVLLKQGYYNYVFAHSDQKGGISTALTEGTHWQTRNDYTLIMYNRSMGLRYDRIIGYFKPSQAL